MGPGCEPGHTLVLIKPGALRATGSSCAIACLAKGLGEMLGCSFTPQGSWPWGTCVPHHFLQVPPLCDHQGNLAPCMVFPPSLPPGGLLIAGAALHPPPMTISAAVCKGRRLWGVFHPPKTSTCSGPRSVAQAWLLA